MDKKWNMIAYDFKPGDNFSKGIFNLIEENVRVGNDVEIRNYVELRKGTIIGDECYIDSRVSTSGAPDCIIGNNVTIRYGSIIARHVIIEDDVFISPQVGFINIPFNDKKKKITRIGQGVKIGFNATIHDGVTIAKGSIIGAKANVTKDILVPGTYIGNPARLLKPNNPKIKIGKNVIIGEGAVIGAQPYLFTNKRELIEAKEGVTIGDNVWIGQNSVILQGWKNATYIGKNVKVAQFTNVGHDSVLEDGVMLSAGVLVGGYAKIGKRTIVGMGATIRNRVTVGAGSFIGMESNVTKDIPHNVIAYGNPCRVIRRRRHPIIHYIGRLRQ